ncbi:MAG: uracil-DNA glycosylase [Phycisphaeraceae bacterium]|nr:MAG: uracil-DNA glycosylase [Phycisphaeraceae bacterium]
MTSRLLGVDFVPSYQSGNPDRPVSEVVEAKPAPVSAKAPIFVAVDDRRSSARAALEALREQYIADAPHQHFVTDHHSIVFGEGDPCARLMFIGEAPGAEEDRTGRPFVGPAGQLLDKMIAAMGLGREDVYIANVLKTRPPNNATPTTEEARLCAPYLFEQIRIISPEAIVTLGRPASQLLLGTTESMGRLRGHWAQFPPPEPLAEVAGFDPIPVMPTYHPAYVLRQYTADTRQRVWSDLQQVMELLGLKARA